MLNNPQALTTIPPAVSSRWLITFGDLLTLLLCFFITVIRLGPLGAPQKDSIKQGVIPVVEIPRLEIQAEAVDKIHGTNFANNHLTSDTPVRNASQAGSLRIDLKTADFDVTGSLLSETGMEKLRGAGVAGETEIETCGGPARAGAWQELTARSLSLHATLKEMEGPGGFVVKMTPSGCMSEGKVNSDLLAIVRFRLNATHG